MTDTGRIASARRFTLLVVGPDDGTDGSTDKNVSRDVGRSLTAVRLATTPITLAPSGTGPRPRTCSSRVDSGPSGSPVRRVSSNLNGAVGASRAPRTS